MTAPHDRHVAAALDQEIRRLVQVRRENKRYARVYPKAAALSDWATDDARHLTELRALVRVRLMAKRRQREERAALATGDWFRYGDVEGVSV